MLPFEKFGGARGLVLNGGGVLGIAHVGALQKLKENDLFEYEYYAGASIGSLIAAALSMDASYEYIEQLVFNLDFSRFMDDTPYDLSVIDTTRLIWRYGWYKGEALEKFYMDVIGTLSGDPNITMQEAYNKFGKHLIMTAYRTNDSSTVEINAETFPNLPVYKALKWSSCYPFFFATETVSSDDIAKYTGHSGPGVDTIFADGGILNNYPIKLLAKYIPLESIIGLHLTSSNEVTRPLGAPLPPPPKNIVEYALGMASATRNQAMTVHISKEAWSRTIPILTGNYSSMDLHLTKLQKKELFMIGAQAVVNISSQL